jgi:tRNA(Arg) A34 adenosine deaminase TadA
MKCFNELLLAHAEITIYYCCRDYLCGKYLAVVPFMFTLERTVMCAGAVLIPKIV